MPDVNAVKQLKAETNIDLARCKHALMVCQGNYDLAKAYLHTKFSGVNRKKFIDGKWQDLSDSDLIELSKQRLIRGKNI